VNVLNRVLMVLMLLVAMVLCSVVLVFPVPVLNAVAEQAAYLVDLLSGLEWYVSLAIGTVLALVIDAFLAFLIALEVRRPSRKAIRVEKAAGGEVLIGVASIADRIRYEVDQLPGVLRTKPKVSGKRAGVIVELDVEGATTINVPEEAEQIVRVVQRAVEEDMGLKLARVPKVNLRVLPYPKTPKPSERPGDLPRAKSEAVLYAEPEEVPDVPPELGVPEESADDLPDLPEDLREAQ
jgi:hypothetical protein